MRKACLICFPWTTVPNEGLTVFKIAPIREPYGDRFYRGSFTPEFIADHIRG
jgi:hypothetical protein